MKTMKQVALAAAISTGLLGASSAMAANDGSLGGTSNGKFDITFKKGSIARIWGFQDMTLTEAAIDEANSITQDVCIYSNKAPDSNKYQLEIASTNKFQLLATPADASQPATPLDYSIKVVGTGNGSGSFDNSTAIAGSTLSVTSSTNLDAGGLANQPNPANDCNSNQNATIKIWAANAAGTLTSGIYADTVTLTVTPQ